MKTLRTITLILAVLGGIAPAAFAQTYTLPVTINSTSCTDDQGDPCGTGGYALEFYDAYSSASGVCFDSTTPVPIETTPSVTATVYNSGGCDGGVGTSTGGVSNIMGTRIDGVDASVAVFVYTLMSSAEQEEDCEYNMVIDNPIGYICD